MNTLPPYALVLHGGAVTMKPGELSADEEAAQREGLADALDAGWRILHLGGTALDAVEAAVRSLELNEHFNAGCGSSLTRQGEAEMDAAIMDGRTLRAGAVTAVKYVQSPIGLARAIMDHSPHVLLSGEGALDTRWSAACAWLPPATFKPTKPAGNGLSWPNREPNSWPGTTRWALWLSTSTAIWP